VVAILSLLPAGPMNRVRLFADQTVDFQVLFSYVAAVVLCACLIASASRVRAILRFSWPLFGVVASYAVIMGLLVLKALGYGLDGAPARIDAASASLNVHHAVIYAAFAVVAAIAWRDRIALPILGLILVAFGAVLELWQTSVPGRTSGLADVVSNGIGVALGLAGVGVMNALPGRRAPGATTSRRRWRRT